MKLSSQIVDTLNKLENLSSIQELEILYYIKKEYPSILSLAQLQINNYKKGNKEVRLGIISSLKKWL